MSDVYLPSNVSDMRAVSETEAAEMARTFLKAVGLEPICLQVVLSVHFVAVSHFQALDVVEGKKCTGWVVGGFMPHLELSDAQISTPIEAIAIYTSYFFDWLSAKGQSIDTGDVPVYRTAPFWEPLSYTPGYEDHRMGAITSFLSWHLIPSGMTDIHHPDIWEMCVRKGWIPAKK